MRIRFTLAIFVGALAANGGSISAEAATVAIDPAYYDGAAWAGLGETLNSVNLGLGALPQSANAYWDGLYDSKVYASAGVTVSGYPIPAIVAITSVTSENPPVGDAGAYGDLDYYFELFAKPGFGYSVADVPILMNGSSTTSSENTDGVTSTTYVAMSVTPAAGGANLFSLPSDNNGGFGATLEIVPNVEYAVAMEASVHVVGGSGSASASIDPTFRIDPTFQYSNDFQLTFSAGIGDGASSAVPEPSSWAMALIGFASIGVAGYRRSRKNRAESAV